MKYNLYNGFMARSLFAPTNSPPLPSPTERDDVFARQEKTQTHPADMDTTRASSSSPLGLDHRSDRSGSSPTSLSSSSDLESGSESEMKPNNGESYCVNGAFDLSESRGKNPRDPTNVMMKIFPHLQRDTLDSVLKACAGDIVRAIEMLLTSKDSSNKCSPDRSGPNSARAEDSPGQRQFAIRPPGAATALGLFNSKSAFSPLQNTTSALTGDGVYGLSSRLGISPFRLAYSASPGSAGLPNFMAPYVTSGLLPALPFRSPVDYPFPGVIRDLSCFQTKEPFSGSIYSRLSNEK